MQLNAKKFRLVPLAARALVGLSCLYWLMFPSMAHAQQCQAVLAQSASHSEWPVAIRLGIRGFIGWTKLRGESQFASLAFKSRLVPKPGASIGLVSAENFFQWRGGLQFDTSYVTKGTAIVDNFGNEATLDLSYYDLALLARGEREVGRRLSVYLLAGPRIGILRDAINVASGEEVDVAEVTSDRDWGVVAGVGAAWAIRPSHHITFDLRTDVGLTTTDASINNDEFKNLAISLSLGYQWSYPPRAARAAPCPES